MMMIGIVDCNNFYASCERVFNPSLNGKAIVVLSNNDGCVIARSNEAKALGIKMGVPAFQIKDLVDHGLVHVFSSNYTLYGDMSSRVMSILTDLAPEIEVYSIDEAFLNLSGIKDLQGIGEQIVHKTTKGTGIPVSLGIAQTKTLAKVANKFAKKYPGYNRVCIIDTEEKRIKALKLFPIEDVWGIGRRHAKKLKTTGINTAYDFTQKHRSWVRKYMTVVGERTWRELQGESCIDMEQVEPRKKSICTSRAFGEMQTEYAGLFEAISSYASICAEKLRKQKSCAVALMVFIHTNNFRTDLPQYYRNMVVQFPVPTSSTIEIVNYAHKALEMIFREGYQYKKAGVIITEIVPDDGVQLDMFDTVDREKHKRIMEVMDKLNSGFTTNQLVLASQATARTWKLKQEKLSRCYTTKLSDVIVVKCK